MSAEDNRLSVDDLLKMAVPLKHTPNLNRLTYQFSFVHQCLGDEVKGVQKCGTVMLENKEEVWSRRLEITTEPRPLPTGWIEDPNKIGFVCVQNLAGEGLETNPTEEEANNIKNSIILLYYDDPCRGLVVPPGFPQIIMPTNIGSLLIRCLDIQPIKCRITIFPR